MFLSMGRLIGGDQAVVVSYDESDAGSQALEDSDNQEVGDFTTGSGGVPAVDNKSTLDRTPPTLTAATVSTNGNAVTLTFDENVVAAVGTLPSALADAFTVTVDGVEREVTGIASFARTQVALQVGSAIHQGQTVTVSYDASEAGTNALLDDADNDVASFTTGENSVPAVTNNSTVASAKLVSVTVNADGTQLTLTFDKSLNGVSSARAWITVTSGGIEVPINAFQGLSVAGDSFTILFSSGSPIYKDEEVVVTYEKPTGSDGFTDQANDLSVVSFTTGQYGVPGVTNNSTVVAPPRLATAEVQTGGNENLSRVQLGPRRSGDCRAGAEGRLHGDRRRRGAGVRRPGVLRPRGHLREARLHRDADPGGGGRGGELRPVRRRHQRAGGDAQQQGPGLHHRRGRGGGGHQQFHGVQRRDASAG